MPIAPAPLPSVHVPRPLAPAEPPSTGFYVHPHLRPDNDAHKGRLLRVSQRVPSGTVLLVDTAYAIVPAVQDPTRDALICSNLACSRRVTQGKSATRCLQNCSDEVIWCDATCRATDLARHVFECAWLKANSDVISRQEGDYNFRTLWHVVRLLAGRHLETVGGSGGASSKLPQQHPWERDWKSVELCCSHLDSWPEPQIGHWRRLAELYLSEPSLLPTLMGPDEMLALICKEESNTFGLYEKLTGPSSAPRGECFGMSLYPRAAMFNHSCAPNVSHQPDSQGRMVYMAARDIEANEECVITYFDLTALQDLGQRQNHVQEQFRFTCTCERCVQEAVDGNMTCIDSLPFSDI